MAQTWYEWKGHRNIDNGNVAHRDYIIDFIGSAADVVPAAGATYAAVTNISGSVDVSTVGVLDLVSEPEVERVNLQEYISGNKNHIQVVFRGYKKR